MFGNRLRFPYPATHTVNRKWILSILACVAFITYITFVAATPAMPARLVQSEPGKLTLAFIPNQGQAQSEVLFQVNDLHSTFFVTANDLVFTHTGQAQKEPSVVRIHHENASASVAINGLNLLKGQVNYIMGQDPAKWLTHLPTYGSVMLRNLYAGIDMQYAGMHGAFESVYYVNPGADPAQIRWQHSGNVQARLNQETGSIELYASAAEPVLVEQAPIVYQEINGSRVFIPARFVQHADGSFSYAISAYDPTQALVIDPTLVYSSYFGGGQFDSADGIALDPAGNIYVTGLTSSTDFPTAHPVQSTNKGSEDIFVIKLNPTGSEMLYSTYLGGSDDEEANSIAVDSAGSIYLAGDTTSADFPLKNAYQADCTGMFGVCIPEAFLARLSADGSQLLYSTYLGGDEWEMAQSVTADNAGSAYVVGQTFSSNFPTRAASQTTLKGDADAFVTHIDTSKVGNASLIWSTYLGGSAEDMGAAIAMNDIQLVITGETTSSDFPTHNALQAAYKGSQDAFITGMSLAGAVQYSTYLGGSGQDTAYGIAVNSQGAYVTGTTLSTDFPTQTPIQAANKGGNDAFVTAINADGSAWKFSTYLGGAGADYGYSIAVNASDAVYVTGNTSSGDFPLLNTLQAYTGNGDAFVAKIKPAGNELEYATLLGGSDSDTGVGIAVDANGKSYVAGNTLSANYPLKDPLKQNYAGKGDVFVSILEDGGTNPPIDDTPVVDPTIVIPDLPQINPLFGSFKFASSVVLPTDQTLTFTILMHNSSMKEVTAQVVDQLPEGLDYKAGTASMNGVYDAAKRTITWSSVAVPANDEVKLTLDCTTTVTDPKIVVNMASITSNGDTIKRYFAVKIGGQLPIGHNRPVVDKFWIDDQDVVTTRDVSLHIQAHDDGVVKKMYIREWQVNPKPVPHWEIVKSSGWVDFAETYPWRLGSEGGVHYVAVAVADDQNNVSLFNKAAKDFVSLLVPDTQQGKETMIPYLVSYDANTQVKATITPTTGNPVVFVWYPGNILIPDKMSVNGTVEFTTPRDGIYYFLVYSATDSTYTFQITPGGGPLGKTMGTVVSPSMAASEQGGIVNDPILSKIGFDPFGSTTSPLPSSVLDNVQYLPFVNR